MPLHESSSSPLLGALRPALRETFVPFFLREGCVEFREDAFEHVDNLHYFEKCHNVVAGRQRIELCTIGFGGQSVPRTLPMVLRDGFEPPTPWSSTKRSTPELSKQMGHWHMPRINLLFNYQREALQPSLKQGAFASCEDLLSSWLKGSNHHGCLSGGWRTGNRTPICRIRTGRLAFGLFSNVGWPTRIRTENHPIKSQVRYRCAIGQYEYWASGACFRCVISFSFFVGRSERTRTSNARRLPVYSRVRVPNPAPLP
jgi:hypothetical protein